MASIAVTVIRKSTGGCELFSVKTDVASRSKEHRGRPTGRAVMSTSDICLSVRLLPVAGRFTYHHCFYSSLSMKRRDSIAGKTRW